MIYLDNAATTLHKPPGVTRAMISAMHSAGNAGRGGHSASRRADGVLYGLRCAAAELFGASGPEQVILTMNATHGINIGIRGLLSRGNRILISPYEHNAVLRCLTEQGADVRVARARPFSRTDLLESFENELRRGADGAAIIHMSNVFGFRLPLEEMAELCRRHGVPFLVDASQSAGILSLDLKKLGADYLAMPGHKGLYGPQGTGLLLCGSDVLPPPLLAGGTGSDSASPWMPSFLPDRLEAGTQNLPGAAGLAAGLDYVRRRGAENIRKRETALIRRCLVGIRAMPHIHPCWPEGTEPESGVLSFTAEGLPSVAVSEYLASAGIAVRAGLHCAPLAHRCCQTEKEGTVRVSVSDLTHPGDIDALLDALDCLRKRERC